MVTDCDYIATIEMLNHYAVHTNMPLYVNYISIIETKIYLENRHVSVKKKEPHIH